MCFSSSNKDVWDKLYSVNSLQVLDHCVQKCGKIAFFISWKLGLFNGASVLPLSVIIYKEIKRRHYFQRISQRTINIISVYPKYYNQVTTEWQKCVYKSIINFSYKCTTKITTYKLQLIICININPPLLQKGINFIIK